MHRPDPLGALSFILQVAIKILDKEKIQKQNMGSQIKKEVGETGRTDSEGKGSGAAAGGP
jgi:hypothetical protein